MFNFMIVILIIDYFFLLIFLFREKNHLKIRKYLPNDHKHLCLNNPEFVYNKGNNIIECHKNCSKFRNIDKLRLIIQLKQ